MSNCVFILKLFVTSPSKLLRIMSTDFLALRLFCFNIRQDGRQILYFKLHVDDRKFHFRRPHATVRCAPLVQANSTMKLRLCILLFTQFETW